MLGEASDEVSERLIQPLAITLEVLGVPGAHVCALEIPDEDLYQVAPVVDLQGREVFEPGSRRVQQEQGEVADDEQVIVRAA